MNSIAADIEALREEFNEFEDGFEKYAYLVELASLLPPYPDEKRTADRLVHGCQSRVWLDCKIIDGLFNFDADSDTLIIRGVLLLLHDLLCGRPPEDVSTARIDLLPALGLGNNFSDSRQKGIGYIIRLLQQQADQQGVT